MEFNIVKQAMLQCPDLNGLDEDSLAQLFWRAQELTFEQGAVIYEEGSELDQTFCLLLSGDLIIERGAAITGGVFEQQIFGEMAYFTNRRVRTATVRVGSPQASVLKFRLSEAELGSTRLSLLRRYLFLRTWNRFVSASQNGEMEAALAE